jgi:hypothetical protein
MKSPAFSRRSLRSFPAVFVFLACLCLSAAAQVSVLTYHNDDARTGQNTNETILTHANVNMNGFGLVSSRPVDDWIYAQPLVVANVSIPGKGTHNIVIVATVNDSLYAFDADDPSVTAPYWQTNFLGPNIVAPRNTDMTGACGGNYQDFHGNMGIIGTPVIDSGSSTLYVVVRTKENGSTYVQRLRALDITTGLERPYSPIVITATYQGNGDGNVGGTLTFNPQKQNQRWGLALVNGIVYVGWASHCDWGPYHGWLIGYAATNLSRVTVYNTTPNGYNGGIWQAGGAPASDSAGNLYFETGNGAFSTNSSNLSSNDYGDSVLKLSTTNGLSVVDYFTPYNQSTLDNQDLDLGSSGLALLPDSVGSASHPHLCVCSGKEGRIYLLDRDNLGKFHSGSDSQIVQSLPSAMGASFDTPAYFNNRVYFLGSGDALKAFSISNGSLSTTPSNAPSGFGFPGATVSISANGINNGIVWALDNSAWGSGGPAVLHAYNATNVMLELYNSNLAGSRDHPAGAAKFTVPTVANGKVYVGGQYALSIFANATFINAPLISPNGGVFTNSVTVTLSDSTPGTTIYYTQDASTPTTNSLLYSAPFALTNTTVLKVKAFKAGSVPSQVVSATFVNSTEAGHGTGLTGTYYSSHTSASPFTGSPTLTRVDPTINFDWGSGSPDPSISVDQFTVRWTGDVQPLFNETYTFYTRTDDGVRLYVNNQTIVNKWVDQSPTEWSGSITLGAHQRYSIIMEYYENGGGAVAQLSWSSPSTSKQIIPASQLYPVHDASPSVLVSAPTNGSSFQAPATITLSSQASDSDGFVARLDYYSGANFLGSTTNGSNYYLTVPGFAQGGYSFTAVAIDNDGVSTTSAPVSITVSAASGTPYGLTSRGVVAPFLNMPSTSSGNMPTKLSQTGVFANTPNLTPNAALIPYNVLVPFWADGSLKTRWFAVPNDGAPYLQSEQIAFAPTGEWDFPSGTVFVQHFDLVTDETNPSVKRRLETRLLVCNANNAVYGVTYKWRPDNSEADLLTGTLYEDILITNASGIRTQTWYYPAPDDCLGCHQPAANYVLGVKTRQLNGNFTYPSTAVTDNQLRTMNRLGLFYPALNETNIPSYTHLASLTNLSALLEDRTRSYLDASCAQCHRPGGTGPTFDARYDTPLTNQNIINAPVQSGDLGYDNARVVVPRDIWRSILYERMNNPDPDIRMPDISGTLIDASAVQLAVDWINSLPGTAALAPPTITPNGGSFVNGVSVTLQHSDPSATLRYTLDNSLPTTNSPLFSGPFNLANSATVKAKAFESGMNDSVAATASFLVRPILFAPGGYLSNGQFQLQFSGLAGKSYSFQASTNLLDWLFLSTNIAPSDVFKFTDPSASNFSRRFYRAIEQ